MNKTLKDKIKAFTGITVCLGLLIASVIEFFLGDRVMSFLIFAISILLELRIDVNRMGRDIVELKEQLNDTT